MISACKNDCNDIFSNGEIILVYDESNCLTCLKDAELFIEELFKNGVTPYTIYAPNSYSEKNINLTFEKRPPKKVILGKDFAGSCLENHHQTSLIVKHSNAFITLKVFN